MEGQEALFVILTVASMMAAVLSFREELFERPSGK
jgi:hypothetical protein